MVMPKYKFALLPLAICISSGSVLAATNAELEKRLEAQEKQIKKLERKLKGTRGAVKQNRNRISDMSDRFKINGFFSGGVATNDGDQVELNGVGDNYSTSAISRLGLQMTFKVSDDMNVTGQLVSKGENDYDLEAEWAYLSWDVTNNFTARIGRQRIPYYLLSEYLEVGYAYPWVRPPVELYNIPISNTDGIGLLYDFNMGDVNFSTQAYAGAGSGRSEQLEGEFSQNQSWGVAQFVEWQDFTFRLGYNRSSIDVKSIDAGGTGDQLVQGIDMFAESTGLVEPLAQENIRTEYISAAASYDDGSLLVMAEVANLRVKDFVQPAGDGGYLTIGYRFGDWMPHVTYAKFYTDSKNDEQVREYLDAAVLAAQGGYAQTLAAAVAGNPGTPVEFLLPAVEAGFNSSADFAALTSLHNGLAPLIQEQQSVTLGLTYDINSRVKAKIEAAHYENFGSYDELTNVTGAAATPGFTSVSGNGRFSGDNDAIDGHTAIYSFSIDAVF